MTTISEKMTVKTIKSTSNVSNVEMVKSLIDLGKKQVKDDGVMWRSVCGLVLRNWARFEGSSDQEAFMDEFSGLFIDSVPPGTDVPIAKTGKNAGKPALRSWPVTKVRWQYATYIQSAVEKEGLDGVFPEDSPLPSLAEVRKMASGKGGASGETPIETIVRCLELAGKKLDEIDYTADNVMVNEHLTKLMSAWGRVTTENSKKAA